MRPPRLAAPLCGRWKNCILCVAWPWHGLVLTLPSFILMALMSHACIPAEVCCAFGSTHHYPYTHALVLIRTHYVSHKQTHTHPPSKEQLAFSIQASQWHTSVPTGVSLCLLRHRLHLFTFFCSPSRCLTLPVRRLHNFLLLVPLVANH